MSGRSVASLRVGSAIRRQSAAAAIPGRPATQKAARQPWATPFSAWAFHRAWWDGYGANAHEETMVVLDDAGTVVAIAPLMHRHEVEPSDELTTTTIRHRGDRLRPVNPMARAVFFGASYHADYATLLAAPDDLPAVAEALADYFATEGSGDWDVVDLRRLRCGDPAADALAEAFRADAAGRGWTVDVEREDVCPVVTFPEGVDIEGYIATLVAGTPITERGELTGARPGRLVRMGVA